jgi:hypothetical protein
MGSFFNISCSYVDKEFFTLFCELRGSHPAEYSLSFSLSLSLSIYIYIYIYYDVFVFKACDRIEVCAEDCAAYSKFHEHVSV